MTAFQRRCLESYVYLRGKPPTLLQVLSFRPRGWLPFLGVAVMSVLLLCISRFWGVFMIGMTVGSILRIIGHARFTVMGWPVLERVLDRERVESVLREDAPPKSTIRTSVPITRRD